MFGYWTIIKHQPGRSIKLEFAWENSSSIDQFWMLSPSLLYFCFIFSSKSVLVTIFQYWNFFVLIVIKILKWMLVFSYWIKCLKNNSSYLILIKSNRSYFCLLSSVSICKSLKCFIPLRFSFWNVEDTSVVCSNDPGRLWWPFLKNLGIRMLFQFLFFLLSFSCLRNVSTHFAKSLHLPRHHFFFFHEVLKYISERLF